MCSYHFDGTPFCFVYDMFFHKVTDDMYMELTEQDTANMLIGLLESAVQKFEFPRISLDYDKNFVMKDSNGETINIGTFLYPLTREEINIIATYMVEEWLGQQLASVEVVRMKYSGSDFKMTSQANHMQKLMRLKEHFGQEAFHLQRLYKRRIRDANGFAHSTMSQLMNHKERFVVVQADSARRAENCAESTTKTFKEVADRIKDKLSWEELGGDKQ